MGGSGSGRWNWHTKATTVEACLRLSTAPGAKIAGTLPPGWSMRTEHRPGGVALVLSSGPKVERIELLFCRPHWGGLSFWLLCPDCGRRCRKLFARPGTVLYRCRQCGGLVYASSQEAHHLDRGAAGALLARICGDLGLGCSPSEAARMMSNRWRR